MRNSLNNQARSLNFLFVLARRKSLILGGTVILVVVTAVVSLVVSPTFEATAKISPPLDNLGMSSAAMIFSQLNAISGGSLLGVQGPVSPSDRYLGILKTDAVLDPVIKRFNLVQYYDVKNLTRARLALLSAMGNTKTDMKTGIIVISVEDKSPQLATDIANALIDQLDEFFDSLSVANAAKRRSYFEDQLKKAKLALVSAEEAFQGFQKNTGVIKLDDQSVAIMKGIAELKAMVAAKEVQLRVMKIYATPNNSDLKKVEEELRGLMSQLQKLEEKESGDHPDLFIPTGQMPGVGTEYLRRMRDLKYNESLFEVLAKQYEAAKLDEARETGIVQVIHRAAVPEERSRPRRTLMVILAGLSSLFLFSIVAFALDFYEKFSVDPENAKWLAELKESFKCPLFPGLCRKKK